MEYLLAIWVENLLMREWLMNNNPLFLSPFLLITGICIPKILLFSFHMQGIPKVEPNSDLQHHVEVSLY